MGISYNNNFYNIKRNIIEKDILYIENKYKFKFPDEIREHFLTFNGGRTERRAFLDEEYEFVVQQFIPIKDDDDGRDLDTVLDTLRHDNTIPNWLIPFADEPSGDLYCFSLDEDELGAIYYWDHECIDQPDESYGYLSESLKEFIESLVESVN